MNEMSVENKRLQEKLQKFQQQAAIVSNGKKFKKLTPSQIAEIKAYREQQR